MIVSNRSHHFGLSHVGVVKGTTFGCMVCTAPDGLFKGCSTLFTEFDGDKWNLSKNQRVVARAILNPRLSKKERTDVHDQFLKQLNFSEGRGLELATAIEASLTMAREAGVVVEYINKAYPSASSGVDVSNSQTSVLNTFEFGKFKLDEKLDDLTGFVEFSSEKYAIMIRRFKGEKNYDAPPVDFLGRPWQLMLSTVHGQICKIAVNISLSNERDATPIATESLQYCKERLGSPSEQETGRFIWDTKDGNVVLHTAEGAEGFLIAIYLTSGAIRKFELL
jgi:hypothetical protein